MTSPRLTWLPLTRTIYSRMGTTEGFSNTGCGWAAPTLGPAQTQGWSRAGSAPNWVPLLGPLPGSHPTGIPGSVGSNSREFVRKRRKGFFSFFDLISHQSSPGTASYLCSAKQFYLESCYHVVKANRYSYVCVCGYSRKTHSRLQLISLNKLTFKS